MKRETVRRATHLLAVVACEISFGAMAALSVPLDGEWTLDYFPQPDDGAVRTLPLQVPFAGQGLIEIEYSADGKTRRNHFLYGEPPFKWTEVKEWMKDTVLWNH